jgi:hypothetical protein
MAKAPGWAIFKRFSLVLWMILGFRHVRRPLMLAAVALKPPESCVEVILAWRKQGPKRYPNTSQDIT